jgi:hypothetical protein
MDLAPTIYAQGQPEGAHVGAYNVTTSYQVNPASIVALAMFGFGVNEKAILLGGSVLGTAKASLDLHWQKFGQPLNANGTILASGPLTCLLNPQDESGEGLAWGSTAIVHAYRLPIQVPQPSTLWVGYQSSYGELSITNRTGTIAKLDSGGSMVTRLLGLRACECALEIPIGAFVNALYLVGTISYQKSK